MNAHDPQPAPNSAPAVADPAEAVTAAPRAARISRKRWVFSLVAMAAAVAVVANLKQPPPAVPASGLSVPVTAAERATVSMSDVLVVKGGVALRLDPNTGTAHTLALPHGAVARKAVGMRGGSVVVVGRDSRGVPAAYFLQDGRLRRLTTAVSVVPSADHRSVWLLGHGVTRQVTADGHLGPMVRLPHGTTVSGANGRGLVVSGVPRRDAHSWLLSAGHAPRLLTAGSTVAVTTHRLLLYRGGELVLVDLRGNVVQRTPWPVALAATGPGVVSPDGRSYALIARSETRERLVVGSLVGRRPTDPHVVPLDGGVARPAPTPVWVAHRVAVALRPDGRLVAYLATPTRARSWVLPHGPVHATSLGAR